MDLVEMLFNNAMNAEGGGGGVVIPKVTLTGAKEGTYTSTVPYQEMVDLILDSPWGDNEDGRFYPFFLKRVLGTSVSSGDFSNAYYHENKIVIFAPAEEVTLNEDGTFTRTT